MIGFGQRTGDVTVYQNTVQNWLTDTAFWTDMAAYVTDWSQEVYGDVRSHAVPGTPVSTRREYLNDYLQHKLVLAGAGPSTIEPARAFLRETYSPLANAAWPRDTAWGWTMVPADQMSAYVSAQVNALRWFSATTGQPRDHWGFAWAPTNALGLSNADFVAQTGAILDRMAAAIRASGDVVEPENPGSGACGPPGQDRLCAGDLTDARHTEAWRDFRTWSQAAIGFTTPAQTIPAGAPSGPITLALVTTTGSPVTTGTPRTVTLSSGSVRGTFATTPAGPWTGTLTLTVAPGAPVTFYYQDTLAGQHTLTASADGTTTGTHVITVAPGAPVSVAVRPESGEVRARGTRRLLAQTTDAFGNITVGPFVWQLTPAALGTIVPGPSGTAVFTANRLLGAGTVTATAGTISGAASVTVIPGRLRIGSIAFGRGGGGLRITLTSVDGARRPVSSTAVRIVVKRDGKRHFAGSGRTGPAGKKLFRVRGARGCFTVSVTRATAQGFVWDGRTPRNRVCRR